MIQNLTNDRFRRLRSTVKGRAIAYSEAILILITISHELYRIGSIAISAYL